MSKVSGNSGQLRRQPIEKFEQLPLKPPTEDAKAGLELILRAYCYTNYGPIGEAKKWLWKVLENS